MVMKQESISLDESQHVSIAEATAIEPVIEGYKSSPQYIEGARLHGITAT